MSSHRRPISPHLTIYRPQITSVLSIMHRITGVALYAGTALMVSWLYVAVYAPEFYPSFYECLASPAGRAVLFGWTLAFYFHFGNGIRHLFWDMGKGYSLPQVSVSGWLVILFAAIMTMFTWGFILHSAV